MLQIQRAEGVRMSTIHLHQTTTSTPEQFLAALIDFGPGRSKVFGNSSVLKPAFDHTVKAIEASNGDSLDGGSHLPPDGPRSRH
jgi:hypothetical protein